MTKEITIIEKSVSPIINEAQTLTIESPEDLIKATETLSRINQWADRVDEDKVKLTKPLNDTLKEIRSRYKPLEEALEGAVERVRSLMGQYQTKALKARQEAADKLAARIGDGKGKLQLDTAVRKIEQLGTVDKSVNSDAGKVTFIEVEKFEVVDIATLPLDFHVANETKIREAMKMGIHLVGVRYWKEQSVRNSR